MDAFCVHKTLWGEPLDGYLVVMNEGLFICTQLLAKAFLFENLDGDLLQYKRSGAPIRRVAIEHFIAPNSKHINQVMFEGVAPSIAGALSAVQMKMTAVLLQFVLLHEIGHIVNRHHALLSEYRFHIASTTADLPAATRAHWTAEYAADEFAVETLCRNAQTNVSRWANFMCVYIFFDWLQAVEQVTGKPICPLHPPPASRADKLMLLMESLVPRDQEIDRYVQASRGILHAWSLSPLR